MPIRRTTKSSENQAPVAPVKTSSQFPNPPIRKRHPVGSAADALSANAAQPAEVAKAAEEPATPSVHKPAALAAVQPAKPARASASASASASPRPVAAKAKAKAKPKTKREGPNWNKDGTYKVGKYQTPEHTRFKPGQSGNPKGSKKKTMPSIDESIIAVAEQKITVTSSRGGKRTMTQFQAMMHRLYEKAMKGDVRAMQCFMDRYGKALERMAGGRPADDALSAGEQEMLRSLLQSFGGEVPDIGETTDKHDAGRTPDARGADDEDDDASFDDADDLGDDEEDDEDGEETLQ